MVKPIKNSQKTEEIKIIAINIDSNKIATIQKQYRLKSIPPIKITELFKLPKTTKMSYGDTKKLILDKIIKDDWINSKDKNLLDLPNDVKEKLGITDNGSISFNDIDKLVCLFYN